MRVQTPSSSGLSCAWRTRESRCSRRVTSSASDKRTVVRWSVISRRSPASLAILAAVISARVARRRVAQRALVGTPVRPCPPEGGGTPQSQSAWPVRVGQGGSRAGQVPYRPTLPVLWRIGIAPTDIRASESAWGPPVLDVQIAAQGVDASSYIELYSNQ